MYSVFKKKANRRKYCSEDSRRKLYKMELQRKYWVRLRD